jgi:SNF2 family DNA or RNA helicase
MSVYHKEWPVLVLTPSTARYHWEAEFQQWLCKKSLLTLNAEGAKPLPEMQNMEGEDKDDDSQEEKEFMNESKCMPLLRKSQIHVMTSSKEEIFPNRNTRVVVCSYGLAPMLINNKRIRPGLFKCAIVDESHMLKNINSKRTAALVPVLHATNRCVLLSGTPALARPSELWPQLKILGTEKKGWWSDEGEFVKNYVRRSSAVRRAELHALLTGTVMIRRMKSEILKSMLPKVRQKAVVDVSTNEHQKEFHRCMESLRQGKGILGKLARQHTALGSTDDAPPGFEPGVAENPQLEEGITRLKQKCATKIAERLTAIQHTVLNTPHQLNPTEKKNLMSRMENDMRREVDVFYRENLHELQTKQDHTTTRQITRKTVLNYMYTLTARAKLPLIIDMVTRWLNDPTKGKLCLFAHHIFMLDEIIKHAGLSNAKGSQTRYIRIDGSTSPKLRQQQITVFQNDPGIHIAVLGLTAAGVAVTLTAAATVWFTELFWTPALMIQAEGKIARMEVFGCGYLVHSDTIAFQRSMSQNWAE